MSYQFNGKMYITKGVQDSLDSYFFSVFIKAIRDLSKTHSLDYLQVFKLSTLESGVQVIEHTQEQPKAGQILYLPDLPSDKLVTGKIFVIDNEEYFTIMWAEDY